MIDAKEVQGEPDTGFEKAGDLGPFECGNCSYMKGGVCMQSIMRAKSSQPRDAEGNVKVGEHDCCEYVDRVGRGAASMKFKGTAMKRRMR